MFLISAENFLDECLKNVEGEIATAPEDERFLAIDTEFIRENQEKPLLCLIQIAAPATVHLIDPMEMDISQLNQFFANPKIRKVFHSASQDLEILSLYGVETKNYYDTQLYESVLSVDASISYQSIVTRYLDINLRKDHSLSDWKRRPLSKNQLQYSTDDVLYLREVYKKQFCKLRNCNRTDWLDDELKNLANIGVNSGEGNGGIYQQLDAWRCQRAAIENVSPRSIVGNGMLKDVSRKGVDFVRRLKYSRNIRNENFRKFLSFAEKITEGLEISEKHSERSAVFVLLKTLLEISSLEHGVAASVIAQSGDLEELIRGNDSVKCATGWRMELFGRWAIKLLNGEVSLGVGDRTRVLIE
ncbi:MAG: hypothetical protein LBG20_03060 [Holosporaceae bacterium]|jgi:ribonuclease D|nr:hypothetical protein [Holosporaceae bacterium]